MAIARTASGSIVVASSTSAAPADQSVAIPADADFVKVSWNGFNTSGWARSGDITLDGVALTIGAEVARTGDIPGAGVAYRVITAAEQGTSKDFHRAWTNAPTQGGICLIEFFSGVDAATPVRDADVTAWEDPGPVVNSTHSLTLDSSTTDYVSGMVTGFGPPDGLNPVGDPASQGQTVDDSNRSGPIANDYVSDLFHEDTPGASTTSVQVQAYYGTLAAISMRASTGGGGGGGGVVPGAPMASHRRSLLGVGS